MKKTTTFSLIIIAIILIGVMGYSSYSEFDEHGDEHDHSVEIEGKEMRSLTVQEVADLWGIDSEILLSKITEEFSLEENYHTTSVLDDIREEYKFSPAQIKDFAEEIKTGNES